MNAPQVYKCEKNKEVFVWPWRYIVRHCSSLTLQYFSVGDECPPGCNWVGEEQRGFCAAQQLAVLIERLGWTIRAPFLQYGDGWTLRDLLNPGTRARDVCRIDCIRFEIWKWVKVGSRVLDDCLEFCSAENASAWVWDPRFKSLVRGLGSSTRGRGSDSASLAWGSN